MSQRLYSKRMLLGSKSRGERIRPKTFKTEAAAKKYVADKKLNAKIELKGKKFAVIQ